MVATENSRQESKKINVSHSGPRSQAIRRARMLGSPAVIELPVRPFFHTTFLIFHSNSISDPRLLSFSLFRGFVPLPHLPDLRAFLVGVVRCSHTPRDDSLCLPSRAWTQRKDSFR